MKSIVISSNSSGGGKTTITLGIMKALMNRGYKVQGYKVGPDYIDAAFHSKITGTPSRNLDLFLMGEEAVKASFSRGEGDYGVVEGVMGLYDGKGIDSECSTAHVAKTLKLPIVLVLSPEAQIATLCAEIKGIMDYEDVNIVGVILNNISEGYYRLLKRAIEYNCGIKVFGYIPRDERLSVGSRHLGLVQSSEIEDLNEKIQICSELIESYVDLDSLMSCFKEVEKYGDKYHLKNIGLRTAVAYDKAFSFYYRENLELLEELGEVIYFSPLKDKELPKDIDFLYLGGGYPEVFAKELSENKTMLQSIKEALEKGLNCYGECGGLMYLTEVIEEDTMVGFFNGNTEMTKTLNNFGYSSLEIFADNDRLPKGLKINCHEFHKSCVHLTNEKVYELTKENYDGTIKKWNCGYVKNNTLAGYGHVHFLGNIQFLKEVLKIN